MAFWRCVDGDQQRHASEDDILVLMNLNSRTNVLIFLFCCAPPPPQGKMQHKLASILKDLVKLCKLMKILSIRYTCTEFLKLSQSKVALMVQQFCIVCLAYTIEHEIISNSSTHHPPQYGISLNYIRWENLGIIRSYIEGDLEKVIDLYFVYKQLINLTDRAAANYFHALCYLF